MRGLLASMTALPNLHPALVHFPIALAVAGLLVDVVSLVLRKRLGSSAAMLYAVAAIAALATYLSGRQAANTVGQLTARAEVVIAEHSDLALLTVLALSAAAVLRAMGAALNRHRLLAKTTSAAAILVMVAANALLAVTADHGGALVYRHGVAVAPQAEPVPLAGLERDAPPGAAALNHLTRGDDGSLHWQPAATDGGALDSVLRPAEGASSGVIAASEVVPDSLQGLRIQVSGDTVVCLPETFGDVVVTATVDLGNFEGVFGLGHHIQSVGEGVFFTVTTEGEARLLRRDAGEETRMDRGTLAAPPGLVTLRTSVAGRHLKGQVGDQTVVHGHGASGHEGAVGLLLDGRGTVQIVQVTVEPARDRS